MGLKYFSMFSGIGGFELGIDRANRQSQSNEKIVRPKGNKSDSQRGVRNIGQQNICIGYSEIDKYAIKVYERQFNGHRNYGDATTINAAELPDFELLVGGFPCQAFSVAGKRAGFNDTRGTLFFDIARILKEKQPRHLVLENVKGLLSHDSGRTFSTIIGVLTDLGYLVEWQVLNSKDFGVPQNRERVFIVGHLGNECGRKVFPISGESKSYSRELASTALDSNYFKGIDNHGQRTAIVHNIYGGFKEKKPRVFEKIAPTIRTSKGGGHLPSVLKDSKIRRLTPTECERLQGFPDQWTAMGVGEEPISDTQRYKMCGNAVTVNVVQAVMERLYDHESR